MPANIFQADQLGEEWQGFRFLALLCDRAPLTEMQARCVLLWCRGMGFAEMARVLGLSNRQAAYDFYRKAVRRLAEAYVQLWLQKRHWADDLLKCFRNQHSGRTAVDADTRTRRGGGDHCRLTRDFYSNSWAAAPGAAAVVSEADLDFDPEEEIFIWLLELRQLEATVLALKRSGKWPKTPA